MTDFNKYFEGVSGFQCTSCGLFFDAWDEKSFKEHHKQTDCKKMRDQNE